MADPAIEAVRRAISPAAGFMERHGALLVAREALEPVRKLHRRFQVAAFASPTCEDAGHDVFEDGDGEWCCRQCTDGRPERDYACSHCIEYDSDNEWPCETACLVYTDEELTP